MCNNLILYTCNYTCLLIVITSGSIPPNDRGPMFFYAQTLFFLNGSSLASLAINLKHNFDRNMAKTPESNDFYFNHQQFQ